jgi:hypothetical protein
MPSRTREFQRYVLSIRCPSAVAGMATGVAMNTENAFRPIVNALERRSRQPAQYSEGRSTDESRERAEQVLSTPWPSPDQIHHSSEANMAAIHSNSN